MSNFLNDGTALPAPKQNAKPPPADPTKTALAGDWNTVCQGLYDLRTAVAAGLSFGLVPQASRPAPPTVTATNPTVAATFIWLKTNLNLYYFNGTTDVLIVSGHTEEGVAAFTGGEDFIDVVFAVPFSNGWRHTTDVALNSAEGAPVPCQIQKNNGNLGIRLLPLSPFVGEVYWKVWQP